MNEILTTIVGNVASAPMRRRTADGIELATFRLASNVRRFDREAGDWVTAATSYVTVTAWRKLGVNVAASFVKGDPVVVYGRLSTREYLTKEGGTRVDVEIDANAVGPDLSRCTVAIARTRPVQGGESGEAQDVPGPRDAVPAGQQSDPRLDEADVADAGAEPGSGLDDRADADGEGETASDDPWGTPAAEPALAG